MLADYPILIRAIGEWLATAHGVTGFSIEVKSCQFRSLIEYQDGQRGHWTYKPLGPTSMNTEKAAKDAVESLENQRIRYVDGAQATEGPAVS